jgi:glycosyltransferase involved in cell wall biosynthesis
MRILVLCHDFPSPSFSDTLPVFYLIKHLSLLYHHDITLVSFISDDARYCSENGNFCSVETPIKIQMPKSRYGELFRTVKNMLSIGNLSAKVKAGLPPNLLDLYYSPQMVRKMQSLLQRNEFDLIYCTRPMANYTLNISLPKVVQPYDAVYDWHRQLYLRGKGIEKLIYGISYKMTTIYEKEIYKRFDACLVVTQRDKDLLTSLCPQINCEVLPNGVDTEYFSAMDVQEEFPSLVFVAEMGTLTNVNSALHFYGLVYPLIRKELPQVKLYLVGRHPAREITDLARDKSVVVTGYVDSVKPYIAKSSIFIAPMILGTGIKNKVLEAMAMGKCVVTTSIGAQGINAVSGEDLIITDNQKEFAAWVVRLLKDEQLRKKMGDNARIVIESQYSWGKIAGRLDQIFKESVNGHKKR